MRVKCELSAKESSRKPQTTKEENQNITNISIKKKMKKVKFKGKYLQNNAYLERSPSPRENPKKKQRKRSVSKNVSQRKKFSKVTSKTYPGSNRSRSQNPKNVNKTFFFFTVKSFRYFRKLTQGFGNEIAAGGNIFENSLRFPESKVERETYKKKDKGSISKHFLNIKNKRFLLKKNRSRTNSPISFIQYFETPRT